ncbi:MAG: AsmA family protein [Pseudomonadota bacterium]
MSKLVKYVVFAVIGVFIVAGIGAGYLLATFNPNDYKAQLIKLVKDKKQRDLRLDGDIKLAFFPAIGANLGKVSLSEVNSDQQFAAIEDAHVSLALLPLLSKQIVVSEVRLSGLQATLIKHKDGGNNIDDLLGSNTDKQPDSDQPVKFDIASVSITNTNLAYLDEAGGAQYALKNLNLKTGRIANGVPGKIDLSATIQANQPKLDIGAQLAAMLTFDLDKKQYELEDMSLQLGGSAADIGNLKLTAVGDIDADMNTQSFSLTKLVLDASGMRGKDNFEVALNIPALTLADSDFSAERLSLTAKLEGVPGKLGAKVSVPKVAGNSQAFKADALLVDLDVRQPQQAFTVKLGSPLSGNLAAQQFNLDNLLVAVSATGDQLPNKSISSEMKGNVRVDAAKQSVQVSLAGGLLQSQIKAKVGVSGFAEPAIQFDVDVDQFDADLYLPKKSPVTETTKAQSGAEQPLDLSALRKLNLQGSLRVGSLKVANVKSSNVRVEVKARQGEVKLSPLSANLYQGSVSGSVSVNAAATPIITVNQKLSGVNVAALGRDAADFDTLEGRGDVGINLTARGGTVSEMKRALDGNVSLNLTDGAIKGINIAKKLREAQAILGKGAANARTQSANMDEKTDFSELKASFKVNNGVARNDDLSLKAPLLRLSGSGDIDIGNDSMNYLAKATLSKNLQGQGGADAVGGITVPVRVHGGFADLKYTLDFGAMVGEAVKQKVEAKKEEIKSKVQDQLRDSLKGLFR